MWFVTIAYRSQPHGWDHASNPRKPPLLLLLLLVVVVVVVVGVGVGCHLKNAYKLIYIYQLLNLHFSTKYTSVNVFCMGIFCVEFQKKPFQFHTKYLPIYWKIKLLYQAENVGALRIMSLYMFLKSFLYWIRVIYNSTYSSFFIDCILSIPVVLPFLLGCLASCDWSYNRQ